MRFEYYHEGLLDKPKLSVDGLVPNSIHLSHWVGNQTPRQIKADLSTEICLNFAGLQDRDALTNGIELVTNNHFDTDGVLSVWTMLNPERAVEMKDQLVAAAASGDFCEFSTPDGIRANITIQGAEHPINEAGVSPLADYIAGRAVEDEADAYALVLPHVEEVILETGRFEELWNRPWAMIESALASFERGDSTVREFEDARLSLVVLASDHLFNSSQLTSPGDATPFTAISQNARGEIFLIAKPRNDGWSYRLDYPYYSWADTIVRPKVTRRDLSSLMTVLNDSDRAVGGKWQMDDSELSSAAKFLGPGRTLAVSSIPPDEVAELVRSFILQNQSVGKGLGA